MAVSGAQKKAVLVVGAGDATGGAIARRFAREGLIAVCTRRELPALEPLLAQIRADGGQAHGFGSDARVDTVHAKAAGSENCQINNFVAVLSKDQVDLTGIAVAAWIGARSTNDQVGIAITVDVTGA